MATLVRWDPLRELTGWQNDAERLMATFLRGAATGLDSIERWAPPMDVWETEDDVVYAFDLPGVSEESISIEFEDGSLSVTAERERVSEVQKDRFYRLERRFGSFHRSMRLPHGVNEHDIKADFQNGVLMVTVTKPKAPEPRKIQVGHDGAKPETIEGKAAEKK